MGQSYTNQQKITIHTYTKKSRGGRGAKVEPAFEQNPVNHNVLKGSPEVAPIISDAVVQVHNTQRFSKEIIDATCQREG